MQNGPVMNNIYYWIITIDALKWSSTDLLTPNADGKSVESELHSITALYVKNNGSIQLVLHNPSILKPRGPKLI